MRSSALSVIQCSMKNIRTYTDLQDLEYDIGFQVSYFLNEATSLSDLFDKSLEEEPGRRSLKYFDDDCCFEIAFIEADEEALRDSIEQNENTTLYKANNKYYIIESAGEF